MIDKQRIVVGGGISGLIWNFFNPEYTIITPEVGGSYGHTHQVWLQDTSYVRIFLEKLGYTDFRRMAKKSYIGYYNKGWIYDYQSPELSKIFIQKKMSEWDKPIDTSFVPEVKSLTFTNPSGANYMNTLDIDLVKVVERLNEVCNIERGFVTKIDDRTIEIATSWESDIREVRVYNKLVSTIPAPIFWKAYGQPREFKYLPVTNIVITKKPKEFDDRYEMVYYDDSVPWSRASYVDGKWALEFTGIISEETFKTMYPDLPVYQYFVIQQGRIFRDPKGNVPPNDKMLFLGRFAQWEYGILTADVIKRTIDMQGKF